MTEWRNIKLNDLDLTLLPMTTNMQTKIKKFFAHVQNVGLETFDYSLELNKWGGRNIINERKQICETVGDLVNCKYFLWGLLTGIGRNTIQTVAKLINALAGETIYTDRMLGIGRPLDERQAETRAKWGQVYELHKAGKSWKDIAKQFSISENSAKTMAAKHRKLNNIIAIPVAKTWQPIETAPKDGTLVLLYWPTSKRNRYVLGSFRKRHERSLYARWIASYPNHWPKPTHWMPLPEPPK